MMSNMVVRRAFLVAVVWTAVVAVGSTLVWTAISGAGRDLITSDAALGPQQDTIGAPLPAGVGDATSRVPGKRPHRRATTAPGDDGSPSEPSDPSSTAPPTGAPSAPSSSAGPSGTPSSPPTGQPSSPPSSPPTSSSSTGSGPANPPTSATPAPTAVRRTWQGEAGAVVAECKGARISLVGAQPNSGWRVEVDGRGPEEVSVHFRSSSEEGDEREEARGSGEVEVHARCQAGAPAFSTG